MQTLKCASCGVDNLPGQTVCEGCGIALVATPYVVQEQLIPPSSTVVVESRGMSDAAKILTGLFAVVALVIVGVLFYQWGQADQSESELERARLERARDANPRSTTPPSSTTSPAPVIVTTPAQPTVITTTTPDASSVTADESINAYKSSMDPVLRRWRDSVLAAEAASGTGLESAITAMREVERSASMVTPPAAGSRVHSRLLGAMQSLISEFTEAARKQTAVSNSATYAESRKQFDAIAAEIEALRS